MNQIDWRVQLVTSGSDRATVTASAAAAAAGVGVVQVRCKEASAAELLELLTAVADAVHAVSPRTRVLVNDRADVAFVARRRGVAVHGVHLGQDDLPVAGARGLLGADAIIGLTAGTLEHIREAERRRGGDRPDYLGCGPFRLTPTKDVGRPAVGLDGYLQRAADTRLPVLAIGDVTLNDIPSLARTGIAGVALVREIMAAQDPGAAAIACIAAWGQ
ncbi:thiamine phosphate synthase [Cumulibacter manganitolerans]|uniref:thiamine phosphate synthase n=1 Tax=Cumulibacter manganitolerans TaxID=1884992 RepID=UPI001295FC67|nr:thiamine phosphate synthase [Cumulibacter manganitolerans]